MKVLVVEDNLPVRETIGDVLQIMEHDVAYAASAEEALDLLQRQGSVPDLLISDINLPGLDGASLLRTIQQRYPHCRGLLTSGLPREYHGLDDAHFMQKPFTLDQLMDHVQDVAISFNLAMV